ncbi:MAG: hypothetical protein VXW14_03585 [Candidatus Thermoplasmatota archaeon]|nr:hypothetical protein [Candidatus Thermoplasmatota archaeon]
MGRGLLGILLASTFLLAGCLAPVAPDWGNDISVERSGDGTFTFTSSMSGSTINSEFNESGCSDGELGTDNEGEIKFEGYMSASQIYESHVADLPKDIAYATSAAIAIHSMSFESAKNVRSGEGERVEVKEWNDPVAPKTGAGTANLEKIDSDSNSKWFVLGLIPASENINDGVAALGKYHQPVRVTGYLVDGEGDDAIGGIWSGVNDIKASSDCVAETGNQNIAQVYVLVTKIELADSVVSIDGEDQDEYAFGDVAILGRAGFILFLLVVGAGGAVGAYMYSSLRLKMSARSIALTLLGKEGVEKAAQVRQDVKDAKRSGMTTPDERRAEQRKQSKPTEAPKKSKKNEDDGFGSFSIDSALSSGGSSKSRSEFGSGSSVVASDDAKRVEKEIQESEPFVPPTSTFGGGAPVSSSVSSASTSVPSSTPRSSGPPKSSAPAEKPKPRRRRAVRKQAEPEPEPEPEPEQKQKEFWNEEEEDFSDFSL